MNNNNSKWYPFSSTAYGANALYIPEWGKKKTLELIMVMNQNYPEFKTHPVMDYFHGYVPGAERFEKNRDYRVLGWKIDLQENFWSFVYLPTRRNDIQALVRMRANAEGRLCIEIEMQNPSEENREWQFSFYCTPGYGLDLPGLKYDVVDDKNCFFEVDGMRLIMCPEGMQFKEMTVCDSNGWINFPLNAEASFTSEDIVNRYKKRLKITFAPITIPPHTDIKAAINVAPGKEMLTTGLPAVIKSDATADDELPYRHALWEALHNRQYVESGSVPGKMTARVIPARQWYKFFIWDTGMTALGALEMDEKFAEEIISEMPDPDLVGDKVFGYGSFIITAAYALWELYQKTFDRELLARYYPKIKRLLLKMYFDGAKPEYKGIIPVLHGDGADDNPALFYVDDEIFTWDYQKTLPVHPDRKKKILLGVGMTCHAIRGLKVLRNMAWLLDKKDDVEYFSGLVEKSEDTLNSDYWDNEAGHYLDRVENEKQLLQIPWIFDWLPLFSGSAPGNRIKKMLAEIYDENKFMTPHGLTLVPQDSKNFRQEGYPNGSAWPPLQYFFWKAAYNIGEMRLARELAEKWLNVYEANHRATLCCWEEFRCDTGKGAGNSRFSGFLTPVIALWASRKKFGRLQCSQDVIINSLKVSKNGANAEFELQSPFYKGKTGFSIVLKPCAVYSVAVNGNRIGEFNTDKDGYMDFNLDVANNDKALVAITKHKS